MNWDGLREYWSIPGPWSVLPISQGVTNLTKAIETPAGSYILRAYRGDRAVQQIRYELGVLRTLQEKTLPFQVPAPIPTVTGELLAVLAGTVVSLTPRLSGSQPQNDDLEQTYAAGRALAELVKALEEIRLEVASEAAPFPSSGDFEAWAGGSILPANLLRELPLAKAEQEQILMLMEETQVSAPTLYRSLPQQIIHRDYDQSNILMEGNSVIGVLDFEFCGPDLRVLDLAYALSQWPSGLWNTGQEWPVIDAFGRGYLQQQGLTAPELEALPLVFHLRATASLFFHLGRFAQGVETPEEILERIQEALVTENWLQLHADELVKHAHGWP